MKIREAISKFKALKEGLPIFIINWMLLILFFVVIFLASTKVMSIILYPLFVILFLYVIFGSGSVAIAGIGYVLFRYFVKRVRNKSLLLGICINIVYVITYFVIWYIIVIAGVGV